ncbi:hypothetical protein JZ751_024241 [Albula glossodonta]|uniref:Uncharacterized protein n=1 Tax=Albula glossodonta TaxID=121402 RepID=A0A8T2NH44_9TELE|nr:hypothetical protein JZ751_024241 [Albula glossodonta]
MGVVEVLCLLYGQTKQRMERPGLSVNCVLNPGAGGQTVHRQDCRHKESHDLDAIRLPGVKSPKVRGQRPGFNTEQLLSVSFPVVSVNLTTEYATVICTQWDSTKSV